MTTLNTSFCENVWCAALKMKKKKINKGAVQPLQPKGRRGKTKKGNRCWIEAAGTPRALPM